MNKKRSKFEIIADILQICKHGARKTRIVYDANLNFKIASAYLANLKSHGFIEERGRLIYTTDRGRHLLNMIKKIIDLLDGVSPCFGVKPFCRRKLCSSLGRS